MKRRNFSWCLVVIIFALCHWRIHAHYPPDVASRCRQRQADDVAQACLAVVLLMIWLPFGKLGHTFLVFITRGTTGMVFERRGAKT